MENIANIILMILSKSLRIILILILTYIAKKIFKIIISRLANTFTKVNSRLGKKDKKIDEERRETLRKAMSSFINVFIWIIAALMILSELGVNITPILTGLGIVGLAIGMGANQLIKDYLSGLSILVEDQYRTGEIIEAGGLKGKVIELNLRRTVLLDDNKVIHYISNSQIAKVSNFSRKSK